MVERYNQPAIPSPLVGTPGVDQSAGKAAQKIADASNAMVSEQQKFAGNLFEQAGAGYRAAGNDFAQAGAAAGSAISNFFRHREAVNKIRNAAQLQLATAQKRPQIEQKINDITDAIGNHVAELSQQDPLAPKQMPELFDQQVQQYRDSVANDDTLSKDLKQQLLPIIDQHAVTRREQLKQHSEKAVENNLQAGINAAPIAAQHAIDILDPGDTATNNIMKIASAIKNVDDQVAPLLAQSKQIPLAAQQEFLEKTNATVQANKEKLSAFGANKLLSGIVAKNVYTNSAIQAGLGKIAAVREIINRPEQYGLTLNSTTQKALLGELDTRANTFQTDGAVLSNLQNSTAMLRNQSEVINPLAEATYANNTQAQYQLHAEINRRFDANNADIKQAEGLPDGPLKEMRLQGLLQQQQQLKSGVQGLIQAASLHNTQLFQQMSLGHQATQDTLTEMGMKASVDDKQVKAMHEVGTLQTHLIRYAFVKSRERIEAMPLGPERDKAVNANIAAVAAFTGWAVSHGTMDASAADSFSKEYAEKMAYSTLHKPPGWFGEIKPQLGGKPSKMQELEAHRLAAKQVADISKRTIDDSKTMRTWLDSVGNSALDPEQQVAAQSYIINNFFPKLEDERKKGLKPEGEGAWSSTAIQKIIGAAQRGTLPEQLHSQQLQIKHAANQQQAKLRSQVTIPPAPTKAQQTDAGTPHTLPDKNMPAAKGFVKPPKAAEPGWQEKFSQPGPQLTQLAPDQETKFQEFLKKNSTVPVIHNWIEENRNTPDKSRLTYDMRGWFQESHGVFPPGENRNDKSKHLPDTYKTKYHESFSGESKYAKKNSGAPHWNSKDQLVGPDGTVYFDEPAVYKARGR